MFAIWQQGWVSPTGITKPGLQNKSVCKNHISLFVFFGCMQKSKQLQHPVKNEQAWT
jgi:hypothetical protein